jgi:hypothetical protein
MNKLVIKIFLIFIAISIGFTNALLAGGVHSTFFVLLPILAFIFGYFFSWKWGLLYGFLLFMGYTFATALMWQVQWAFIGFSQYLSAFIFGGFSIVFVGALASFTRKGAKKLGVIGGTVVLLGVVTWCGYISMPHYRYSYAVNILCQEDMEVNLPVSVASDELSMQLLKQSTMPVKNDHTDWWGVGLVDTEYGKMWSLNLYSRLSTIPGGIGRSSNWGIYSDNIRSWPGRSPNKMIQLAPKFDIVAVDRLEPSALSWPQVITQNKILDSFNVPVKIKTDTRVEFNLLLYVSIVRTSGINFGYHKDEGYTETIEYKGITGDQWIMVPVEAKNGRSVTGIGD